MVTFHCTQKTRRRFGFEVEAPVEPTGQLGNWYANLLNVGTGRWVVCISERSLLPVLVPARNSEFPPRFPSYLERVLRGIGVPPSVAERESLACAEWTVAKTEDRSVLGSLNDFVYNFEVALRRGRSPESASIDLAGMPCSPLDYHFPDETTFELLDLPHVSLKRRDW